MHNREKVITALEFCSDTKPVETCFGKCPYAVADDDYRCRDMKLDALALIKEQEPVEPETDIARNRRCPKCFTILKGKFCHECGQAVKWE